MNQENKESETDTYYETNAVEGLKTATDENDNEDTIVSSNPLNNLIVYESWLTPIWYVVQFFIGFKILSLIYIVFMIKLSSWPYMATVISMVSTICFLWGATELQAKISLLVEDPVYKWGLMFFFIVLTVYFGYFLSEIIVILTPLLQTLEK